MKKTIQKRDVELLVHKIREMGLLGAMEWSDWDDFDGHDLGDAIESFKTSMVILHEAIEDTCIEKGIEYKIEEESSPDELA